MENIQNMIIGFGKAGKTLAAELGNKGQKTILVEKSAEMYGGTCINIACIPTKFLRERAAEGLSLHHAVKEKNALISELRANSLKKVDGSPNVEVVNATAAFVDENTVKLTMTEGGSTRTVTSERIFINTGTIPRKLDIEGVDVDGIYDSTTIMQLQELPEKLVIVGGGFIGLEFATIFADFGSSVTVIDRSERFLEKEDADIAARMKEMMEKQNISFQLNAEISSFSKDGNKVQINYKVGADEQSMTADAILLATGRQANLEGLKVENAAITLDKKGFIQVDSQLKTNIDHIWALGDINGGPQFTYISLDDYRIVKNQILGGKYNSKEKRKPFATAVFTNPPLAHIGKKEQDLENPENYMVHRIEASSIPKSHILGQPNGLLKAIVNKERGEIEGCTLLCAEAHEMINTVKTVMDHDLPYTVLQNQIFTHPTMSEGLNDLFNIEL